MCVTNFREANSDASSSGSLLHFWLNNNNNNNNISNMQHSPSVADVPFVPHEETALAETAEDVGDHACDTIGMNSCYIKKTAQILKRTP